MHHFDPPPPLVCIPYAGAGPSVFARWRARFGGDLIAVSLPGREATYAQAPLTSIASMADLAAAVVEAHRVKRATLFGHSMGGLVAYEAAKLLRESRSIAIARLVVSGCQSPASPSRERLSAIVDDVEFMRAVAAYGGVPDQLVEDPVFVEYALPILRADLAATDAYQHRPGARLSIPILALGAEDDRLVPLHDLFGWRDFTSATFEARVFSGGHFFINEHTDAVLAMLRERSP